MPMESLSRTMVYADGRLIFELINGMQIDIGYTLRTGGRKSIAKDKEDGIYTPAQSSL